MFYLAGLSGEVFGKKFPLQPGEITIGRSEQAQIHITDQKASSQHCKVFVTDEKITVSDLRSRNGTFVNGVARQIFELRAGDRLVIGTCVFELRKDAT